MPWRENVASNFGRAAFDEAVVSTSTSRNQRTRQLRLGDILLLGPRKSIVASFQGERGRSVILSGSGGGWLPDVAAWQGRQSRMVSSTIVSMLGNQTFERSKRLVLMIS